MAYRPLPDPNEMRDVDIESPQMQENARLLACGERQLRMLRRMGDVGMELVERLGQIAMSGAGPASGEGAADTDPATIDSIAGAYVKLTQSLRRTLAMESRLSEAMKTRRFEHIAACRALRLEKIQAVHECIDENIAYAMTRAIRRERPDADRETAEKLLADMFERLNDGDDFEDYRETPPGETIAKLCAAFGLDPEFCIQADDETWMMRHGTEPDQKRSDPPPTSTGPGDAGAPHPDHVAICPSP